MHSKGVVIQGTQLGNATDFGHTTLANLNPNDDRVRYWQCDFSTIRSSQDSWILWIHVFIAFLMFPCSIFLMRRFSIGLKMRDTSLKITRTIAIENSPPLVCTKELIKEHFEQIEAYRNFKINDIQVTDTYQTSFSIIFFFPQLVYDVSKLTALSQELENVVDSRKFSEAYEVTVNQD